MLRIQPASLKMSQPQRLFAVTEACFVFPDHVRDLCLLSDLDGPIHRPGPWQALSANLGGLRSRVREAEARKAQHTPIIGQHHCLEYFLHRLATGSNVLYVLTEVLERAAPSNRYAISEAVEQAFWNEYDGVLLHPWIRMLLQHLEISGAETVMLEAERLLGELHWASSLKQARIFHANSRARAIRSGHTEEVDEHSVAAWELLADYFLLQRALAEDVRRASRIRAAGETTAARLARIDAYGRTYFHQTRRHVSSPRLMVREWVRSTGERIDLPSLVAYGKSRQGVKRSVLLSYVPGLAEQHRASLSNGQQAAAE